MRQHRLVRATLGVAAVFVVGAIVFAAVGQRPADVEAVVAGGSEPVDGGAVAAGDGAVHFEQRCGRCHEPADSAGWARAHPDAAERGEWLGDVLQGHFPPPEGEREAIIGFIQRSIEVAQDVH